MYRTFVLVVICAVSLMWTAGTTDAQRKRSNPFSDFHKQGELAIGKPAPAMHLEDSDGDEFDLRDKLGSWVFIEFGSYT